MQSYISYLGTMRLISIPGERFFGRENLGQTQALSDNSSGSMYKCTHHPSPLSCRC